MSDDNEEYESIHGDISAEDEDSGIKSDDDETEAQLLDLVSSHQHSDPNISQDFEEITKTHNLSPRGQGTYKGGKSRGGGNAPRTRSRAKLTISHNLSHD